MYVFLYNYDCVHVYAHMCACSSVCSCVHVCMHVNVCVMNVCIHVCACVHICSLMLLSLVLYSMPGLLLIYNSR